MLLISVGLMLATGSLGPRVTTEMEDQRPMTMRRLIMLVVWVIYYPCLISSKTHATSFKYSLKMKVVDRQGRRITMWRATCRELAKVILGGPCLALCRLALCNPQRRALHDRIADTLIVHA